MYAVLPLLGGAAARRGSTTSDPISFAAAVVLVYMVTNALNFSAVAVYLRLRGVLGVREAFATVYRTLLPFEFATALLTAGAAFTYERIGIAALILLVVVLGVFHHLARTAVAAHDRGEELMQRTEELGTLQVGVLTTVLQTLAMRDAMTARHSAAVARYSREVARLLGCDEREQDLIHTAALLHDIGKFILPDSVLFANRRLTDDEWELVKLHPESGRQAGRAHRRLRAGRADHPAPPRALRGRRLPGGDRGRGDPARLAHHRLRGHLRRHDLARLLPPAREHRGRPGRAAPRLRHPARPARRRGLRADDRRPARSTSRTPTRPTSSTSWTPVRSSAPGDAPKTRVSSTPSRRAATRRSEVSRPSVTRRFGAPTSLMQTLRFIAAFLAAALMALGLSVGAAMAEGPHDSRPSPARRTTRRRASVSSKTSQRSNERG